MLETASLQLLRKKDLACRGAECETASSQKALRRAQKGTEQELAYKQNEQIDYYGLQCGQSSVGKTVTNWIWTFG
jgi:hypothetical protein